MTLGRLWWLLKRDVRRGWAATWHNYRTVPKLDAWTWPHRSEPPAVEVHVLTGANDWRLCMWMLATWFHVTERSWRVVVHDDGTLTMDGRARLEATFPYVRVISRREADAVMKPVLTPYVECAGYRAQHPLGLKLFDVPHFAEGERFLLLDSDLVWFHYPREIMDWVQHPEDRSCWFNEDVAEGALITHVMAERELGVKLWSRVNTGLCLMAKEAVDPQFCERALTETPILRGHIWRVEQTLLALCASRFGHGGLLPQTYEVSLAKWAREDAVMRHYVGAVRQRFYGEGIARMYREVLAKE